MKNQTIAIIILSLAIIALLAFYFITNKKLKPAKNKVQPKQPKQISETPNLKTETSDKQQATNVISIENSQPIAETQDTAQENEPEAHTSNAVVNNDIEDKNNDVPQGNDETILPEQNNEADDNI